MKIRILSCLVIAVLAVSLLAGCNSKSSETSAKSKTDAVTTASIVDNTDALVKAIGKDGKYIAAILNDITTDKELVLEGEFHDKMDASKPLKHKLALYAQDENKKVTARYTLTAPKLTIKSENALIQGGTFKGDVYVEANGFKVQDATIDGNIYFAKQEYKDSFVLPTEEGKAGKVTGTMEVK